MSSKYTLTCSINTQKCPEQFSEYLNTRKLSDMESHEPTCLTSVPGTGPGFCVFLSRPLKSKYFLFTFVLNVRF